jgi:outer membrane protein insertion porin family
MKTIILLAAIIASSVLPAAEVVEVKAKALDGFGGEVRSVLSRCQTKVGARYDPVAVTRDINELKDSGEFEDISADARRLADGVEVTFFVKRKIRFHAPLTVRGAGFYGESKIASLSELKDGYLYGEADLAAAAAKVRQAYRKKCFHEVKVAPLVETSADGVSTVTLLVDEGERRKIRSFEFDGAVNVEAGELRAAVGDLPWWNPVGWFSDAPVTEELRAQCIAKIEEVYRNHGYLDVKVSEPVLETVAPGKADVRFKIAEGVQYKIGIWAENHTPEYEVPVNGGLWKNEKEYTFVNSAPIYGTSEVRIYGAVDLKLHPDFREYFENETQQ